MRVLATMLFLFLLFCSTAHAAEPANTYDGMASFRVTVSPQFTLEKLGSTGEAAVAFAYAMPADARGLSIVGFRGKDGFYFRLAAAASEARDGHKPNLAVQPGNHEPFRVSLAEMGVGRGTLASVAVWSPSEQSAIVAMAFADGEIDTRLYAIAVLPTGWVEVDLGGAKTLGGQYELRDLDGDGSYELLTERTLDGWAGGISYKAVRTYDKDAGAYRPDPARFRDFYRGELAYYDWVLATRDKMLESPESYMSQQQRGMFFAADYQGRSVGFDSLVPLEDIEFAGGDIAQWNLRVDSAVRRVTDYRDQLKAWLDGGDVYPSAWQMKR